MQRHAITRVNAMRVAAASSKAGRCPHPTTLVYIHILLWCISIPIHTCIYFCTHMYMRDRICRHQKAVRTQAGAKTTDPLCASKHAGKPLWSHCGSRRGVLCAQANTQTTNEPPSPRRSSSAGSTRGPPCRCRGERPWRQAPRPGWRPPCRCQCSS